MLYIVHITRMIRNLVINWLKNTSLVIKISMRDCLIVELTKESQSSFNPMTNRIVRI